MYRSVTHCVRSSVVVVLLFIRHIGEHYNNENTNKLKKKRKERMTLIHPKLSSHFIQ